MATTARRRSTRSLAAEAAFRARVAELGGVVLEHAWLGAMRPHRVRCPAGHDGHPRPHDMAKGIGICRVCSGKDPATAAAAFHARLAELGGVVLEPVWLGANTPHRVRCSLGHETRPRPGAVAMGGKICRVCARASAHVARSKVAEAEFHARVAELGGVVLEPVWLGVGHPHRVRCAAGHDGRPRPAAVQQGQGLCQVCAGNDPATAERKFRARVAELGGVVLEPVWLGSGRSHRVRCAAGHDCSPTPSSVTSSGNGLCRVCSGIDQATAEAAFRARVAELGGVVLDPVYVNAHHPHRTRCAAGHEGTTTPHYVSRGGGICRPCAGKTWDAFYVVVNRAARRLKFGITSGNPAPRLGQHRAAGYRDVVRLFTLLPGDTAPDMERAALAALALADMRPVRGREYFDVAALAVVLDVVDGYGFTSLDPTLYVRARRAVGVAA